MPARAFPAGSNVSRHLRPKPPYVYQGPVVGSYSSVQGDGGNDGSAITTDLLPMAGDLLVVCVTDSQSATPPTPPSGWTQITIPDTDQSTNFENYIYVNTSPAVSTTYTWTLTGGRRTIIGALLRGVDPTFDVVSSLETVTATTHLSPTLTTTGVSRKLLAFLVLRSFPTCAWTPFTANGWREVVQRVGADGVTNMQVSLQVKDVPVAGAYSDTFTCAASEPAIIVLLAAQPIIPTTPITLTDTGGGSDTVSVSVTAALADSGAAGNSLVVAASVPLTDSGAGADTAGIVASVPLVDTGVGVETSVVAATVPLTDTAVCADTVSVVVPTTLADSGTATDTPTIAAAVPLADAGSGADTATVAAAVPLADSGTASQTSVVAAVVSLSDTAMGTDTSVVAATVPLSDTATAGDLVIIAAAVPLGDTAVGTDTVSVLTGGTPALVDSGTATDAISVAVTLPTADAGAAVESVVVAATVPLTDTATAAEASTVATALAVADTGVATDVIAVAATVLLTDSGACVDTFSVATGGTPVAVADAGVATDSLAVTVVASLADVGTAIDSIFMLSKMVALADAGAVADLLSIPGNLVITYRVLEGVPGVTSRLDASLGVLGYVGAGVGVSGSLDGRPVGVSAVDGTARTSGSRE